MSLLLKKYIREILSEMQDYRVPTQLISPKTGEKTKRKEADEEEIEEIEEMSMAGGGIAGFVVPFGLGSDDMKKSGKKKKPATWK